MKKVIFILGLFGLILVGGLYAKLKFYAPKSRLDNVKLEVEKLTYPSLV